jgi:hypothetical protein
VLCPQRVFHIGQKAWRLITGGLEHLTVEPPQGVPHALLPGVMLPAWSCVLQQHRMAHGLYAHQTQTAGTRFVLGDRDVFGWHLVRQARTLRLAGPHDSLFHVTVDLLLGPVGGANQSIETSELQAQAHQAHPAGPDLNTHHRQGQNETRQASQPWRTVEKRHDRRALVTGLLVRSPRRQRAAGALQHLGRLALGDALGVPLPIACIQVSALAARPALVAIRLAIGLVVDYRCHRLPPLPKPLPCEQWKG